MIQPNTILQNRYLIEKQIGEGGMGAVYLAIDQRFGSPVAIKETFYQNDVLGEAFEREARLLNSLQHPALPHVSDYFAENNGYFLVMQFIEGEDLFETLKREGAFPVKEVLRWTDSLLDALDYLHSQDPPIIHRDIKPQNMKINARGDVTLLDFGLAKLSSEDSTGMKSIFGYTRKYSPLEQIQGTGTDVRSDIFSLAATAYHLLTGRPAIDVIARASTIIHGNPDPLRLVSEINSEVPVSVANVLNSALALNADRRFVSAKAMRQALEYAISATPTENVEELPNAVVAVVAPDDKVVEPAEIESFTALEAFAADEANGSLETNVDGKSGSFEILISKDVISSPAPENTAPQQSYVGDLAANVAPRTTKPARFRFAAVAAALLICSAFAALFFAAKPYSTSEAVQTNTESNSNTAQSEVVFDAPTPKVTLTPLPENTEQPKTKSVLVATPEKKKEVAVKPTPEVEMTEKPNIKPPVVEVSRSKPEQTTRRREPQPRAQTRPRVTENESAPDIEAIFTGNQSARREESRNQADEEMSQEEIRETRRQRRQERRQRQNRGVIPF